MGDVVDIPQKPPPMKYIVTCEVCDERKFFLYSDGSMTCCDCGSVYENEIVVKPDD